MNNYEKTVKDFAPCGADCSRCASYADGDIVKLSIELKERLAGFENFAEKLKGFMPMFNNYNDFLDILNHFANGNCPGCRNCDKPKCQCSINSCIKEHNVNFCFECSKFKSCDPVTYNEQLKASWKENNSKMQTSGIDNFYIEKKSQNRY